MTSGKSDPYKRFVEALERPLAAERLNAYRRAGDSDDLDSLARYTWNMAISEALYPALQCLEIALRNTLHEAVAAQFASPQWLTTPPPALAPREADAVAAAILTLSRQRKPATTGRLIAELNFGFWTSLLDRRYEPTLWPVLLRPAFPYLPRRRRTRHTLSVRFTAIRRLRNRVFHHEPIWHWQDLAQQHRDVIEALHWISPPLAGVVVAVDRFPAVHAGGPAALRARLNAITGTR